jgi:translation initiation factor 2 subunit 3
MSLPNQPEINIGMIGHVDHGKTTLTQRLTGKWADEHSEELKRGISIKLGYADTAFYKCTKCDEPEAHTNNTKCPTCGGPTELLRVVSFVDAPGHETLMAIMLSGAAIMDGAILVIAANEPCPQPQTREHLTALDLSGIKNIVIVQNKIDLVTEKNAVKNYEQILKFVKGTCAENAPIIPVSAHQDINIDVLIKAMEEHIPTPERDLNKSPVMYTARSFDINKPGARPDKLKGGVIGGSLIQGVLKQGEEIEICPGRRIEEAGRQKIETITTKVDSLFTGGKSVKEA